MTTTFVVICSNGHERTLNIQEDISIDLSGGLKITDPKCSACGSNMRASAGQYIRNAAGQLEVAAAPDARSPAVTPTSVGSVLETGDSVISDFDSYQDETL